MKRASRTTFLAGWWMIVAVTFLRWDEPLTSRQGVVLCYQPPLTISFSQGQRKKYSSAATAVRSSVRTALYGQSEKKRTVEVNNPREKGSSDKNINNLKMKPPQKSASLVQSSSSFSSSSSRNLLFQSEAGNLIAPAIIGVTTGCAVATFKLSVESLRTLAYGNFPFPSTPDLLLLIPALGGLIVGAIVVTGGPLPPGLRDTVEQVDQQTTTATQDDNDNNTGSLKSIGKQQWNFFKKSSAAIVTLGTGNSLGPEGPSVELGMNVARGILTAMAPPTLSSSFSRSAAFPSDARSRNRLLLSCGAAAGVSAGFNAPLAGVFFTLEVMQGAFQVIDQKFQQAQMQQQSSSSSDFVSTAPGSISAVLLSSVLSALVARQLLGDELVLELSQYEMNTPFLELPIYLVLGALSGVVAATFSKTANTSQKFFQGKVGPSFVKNTMKDLPKVFKPALGGLFCGVVGLAFPQILFFGYETLNNLLAADSLSTQLVLSLLAVKLVSTAVCVGSGLVGGTFAPSLFLGAMLGAGFHDLLIPLFVAVPHVVTSFHVFADGPILQLADVQAYATVGAGSVLAALFRAPLTASLLLFELTRDYDVILPLMASAGVGSVVADMLDGSSKQQTVPPLLVRSDPTADQHQQQQQQQSSSKRKQR